MKEISALPAAGPLAVHIATMNLAVGDDVVDDEAAASDFTCELTLGFVLIDVRIEWPLDVRAFIL